MSRNKGSARQFLAGQWNKENRRIIILFLILVGTVLVTLYSVWQARTMSVNDAQIVGGAGVGFHHMHPPSFAGGHPAVPYHQGHFPSRRVRTPVSGGTDTRYAVPLAFYTVLFFAAIAAFLIWKQEKKWELRPREEKMLLWTLLMVGFLLRVAVAPWTAGHPFDMRLFIQWATTAAKDLGSFYVNSSSDYPPLYIYVLFLVGKGASLPGMSPSMNLLIKMPSMLADVVTAYLIYRLAGKRFSKMFALFLSAFYIFNPAVIINSTFWGQVDSFFAMLVVVAVFLLSEQKLSLSAIFFASAVLMKPQGLIFLPVMFFEWMRRKSVRQALAAAVSALGTALAIILPFSWQQGPLWIFQLYAKALGEYPFASVNAFNFFSLLGANYTPDSTMLWLFSYHTWGMLLIALVTAYAWWVYIRGRRAVLASIAALLLIDGVFTFSVGMHERYLFPAVALALVAFLYFRDKRLLWLSLGFSATVFVNTFSVYFGRFDGTPGVPYSFVLCMTSLVNVSLFLYLAKVAWEISRQGKAGSISLP